MGILSKIFPFISAGKRKEETVKHEVAVLHEGNELVDKLRAEISDLKRQLQDKGEEDSGALIQKIKSENEAEVEKLKREIDELQSQLASGAIEGGEEIIQKIKSDNEAQIKKLKREIEDLQDELDDAESDLRKAKKNIEEKSARNGELEDELTRIQRSMNDLSSELERKKEELEETFSQLSLTSGSLDFVEEVLTAVPLQDESLSVKWAKISDLSNFIFFDLQELAKRYFKPSELSEYIFGHGLAEWEAIKKKSWIEGKKTVAFIGEFSAGKTSIVNRILSQDNPDATLLPVSAKATTAIPTYIAGGDFTTYQFVSPDGTLKGISEKTFKQVSKEILGKIEGVSSLISYFVMTYKNPLLNGMSILDTPGFSSGDREDAVRTIDVINECDALFWVFDVNAGTVNRSSLKIIKENMTRPLFVVINKVDTKSKRDVDDVEKLIGKAFDAEGIKVEQYIRFSSKEPIDKLMGAINSVVNDNSAQQYISQLVDDYMPSLIEACENDCQNARQALQESNQRCDDEWNVIISQCRRIQDDSIKAANIPHWEEHIFRKNQYEMSESEGHRLINLLDKVANDEVVNLAESIDDYSDMSKENQQLRFNLSEEEYVLRQFTEYQEKLTKLINALK